jgi:hypothetical protein
VLLIGNSDKTDGRFVADEAPIGVSNSKTKFLGADAVNYDASDRTRDRTRSFLHSAPM